MTVLDEPNACKPATAPTPADGLDALSEAPWRRFHTIAVLLFGVGWAMDAFEVTLIGTVLGALRAEFGLGADAMSLLLGAWFAGLMLGAVGFGVLADRHGRRRVFLASLVLYGLSTMAAAVAPGLWALLALRFLAGIGVGAEYSAINGAIGELLPVQHRGRAAAIVMNFWPVGAMLAALVSILFLNLIPQQAIAWRLGFALGAAGGLFVAYFRRVLPESPRSRCLLPLAGTRVPETVPPPEPALRAIRQRPTA